MLSLLHGLAHGENGGRGSHGVTNADDGLLRNARVVATNGGEHRRAQEGECQTGPVYAVAVGIEPVEHTHRGAERRNLCERQIHEDHAALYHVHPKIGVNPCQNETRNEGRREKS